MNKEEDGGFSLVVLALAIVLYIAILCMSFAGLVALDEHGKSVVVIFTGFVKDYGSLLAGIPVLIAVLVAKQQLDANRRQHVAIMTSNLQPQMDAVEICISIAEYYTQKTSSQLYGGDIFGVEVFKEWGLSLRKLSDRDVNFINDNGNVNLISEALNLNRAVERIETQYPNMSSPEQLDQAYNSYLLPSAKQLLGVAESHQKQLSSLINPS